MANTPNVYIGETNDDNQFKELAEWLLDDPARPDGDHDTQVEELSKAILLAVETWWSNATT